MRFVGLRVDPPKAEKPAEKPVEKPTDRIKEKPAHKGKK